MTVQAADLCPAGAKKLWGREYTVEALMEIIRKDKAYYDKTGGGVTLSGGEVTLQSDFAEALLKACKAEGINTCIETALATPWQNIENLLPYTDLIITDIKHMDTKKHKKATGAGNEQILENIIKTVTNSPVPNVTLRTPIVIGYNDDQKNIEATAEYIIKELKNKIQKYQLLPLRKMGTEKYASLGIPYPMEDYEFPEREVWETRLKEIANLLKTTYKINATPGTQ
jgi:pyruvate formate lyase activating enzyme